VQWVGAGGHDPVVVSRQARARRGGARLVALLLTPRDAGCGVEGGRGDDAANATFLRRRAMMGRSRRHRHAADAGGQEHEECEARPRSSTHGHGTRVRAERSGMVWCVARERAVAAVRSCNSVAHCRVVATVTHTAEQHNKQQCAVVTVRTLQMAG
jgi:hypothetical protein